MYGNVQTSLAVCSSSLSYIITNNSSIDSGHIVIHYHISVPTKKPLHCQHLWCYGIICNAVT